MAKEYGSLPATVLLGEHRASGDPYLAYCINEAIALWGAHVEAALNEASAPTLKAKEKAEQTKQRSKLQAVVKRLMEDPLPETEIIPTATGEMKALPPKQEAPKKFRDPAELFR